MRFAAAVALGIVCFLPASSTRAQATQAAAAPATQPIPADQLLNQMLRPPGGGGGVQPLQPIPSPHGPDATTGAAAVAPGAQQIPVMREGTFIIDRTGRLTRGADGQSWEFTFDSDGRAMQDPPVVILPNLKLMQMERQVRDSSRDLHFRITGMVTEYNGRNHVLLEKVVVVPDNAQQF